MNSSVVRSLRILDLLVSDLRPRRLGEIAHALDASRSGLHGLLATLVECGYVEHLPGGFYQLGMKAWRMGHAFPTADLVQTASPIMDRLVGEVGEGSILGVLNGAEVSYVHLAESSQVVRVHAAVGDRIAASATSTGLALLAFQDEGYVDRHFPADLVALSEASITDLSELKAELRRTRARGYSVNRGGWHADVGGIAAPVMGPRGPVAALCIALPRFRMNQAWIRKVAPIVQSAAAGIARGLSGKSIERRVSR